MPRSARKPIDPAILEAMIAVADGPLDEEEKLNAAEALRGGNAETSRELDRALFARIGELLQGMHEAKGTLTQQHAMMRKLMAPPWFPATFLGPAQTSEGERAIVLYGSGRRIVGLAEGLRAAEIKPGEEVYLSETAQANVARAGVRAPGGEVATFERRLPDGRIMLRSRDEEIVAEPMLDLGAAPLRAGDLVRVDRQFGLAFEPIAKAEQHDWLRDDAPEVRREEIGGQETCVRKLIDALTVTLVDPERAKLFRLEGRKSILLHGKPGCGKTLMARYAVSEVARLSGKKCKFVNVSPAQWESKWVGETEAAIRHLFAGLREAAARDGFVVLFLDELDAVGATRSHGTNPHSARFLNVLLSQLDGFTALGNVACISATNRVDSLDSALAERLGATQIHVPRPNQRSARAIFGVHLPESLPFSPNGAEAAATRAQILDAAVSRLFAPNADNAVCLVRYRDGTDYTVRMPDLVSGRLILQMCETACRSGFLRQDAPGLQLADIEAAAESTIERMRGSLTVHNIHAHVDLAPDLAVLAVQPLGGKVKQPHRYLNP